LLTRVPVTFNGRFKLMLVADGVTVRVGVTFVTVTVVVVLAGRYVLSPWYCTVKVSVPAASSPGTTVKV